MAKGGLNQANPCDVRFVCTDADCDNMYSAAAGERLNKICNCGKPLKQPIGNELIEAQNRASVQSGFFKNM